MGERLGAASEEAGQLPAEAQEILGEVERLSGQPVQLVYRPHGEGVRASTRVARGSAEPHVLRVDPGQHEFLPHLVAQQGLRLLRLFSAPAEERFLPDATEHEFLTGVAQTAAEVEALGRRFHLRAEYIQQLTAIVVRGLTFQVVNLPVEIKVERYLWRAYPSLRGEQARSLRHKIAQVQRLLEPRYRRLAPPTPYLATNAMNYAWCKALAGVLEDATIIAPYLHPTRAAPYEGLGEQLHAVLEQHPDTHQGDRALIDQWARLLGLEGWYHWELLESSRP
jgi:hypothetical protein